MNYNRIALVFEHLVKDCLDLPARADLMYNWNSRSDTPDNIKREGMIVAYTHTGLNQLIKSGKLSSKQKIIVAKCIDDLLENKTVNSVVEVLQKMVDESILL